MLKSVTVISSHYSGRIASSGKKIEFKPGINLLVGSNGSGKSTLFSLILAGDKSVNDRSIEVDYEGSPAIRGIVMQSQGRSRSLNGYEDPSIYRNTLLSHFQSHGESNWPILEAFKTLPEGSVIMFDEPEQALDFQHLQKFIRLLKKHELKFQFIICTHEPMLIFLKKANVVCVDKDHEYISKLKAAYLKALS